MLLIDTLITVAPLLSYYSQYSLIKQSKSVGSFSIDICAILIVANILRICFWFSTGFANNLLLQSFIILAMQYAMLDLCINLGYKKQQDTKQSGFWRWDTMRPFVIFGAVFGLVMLAITALFVCQDIKLYGTILGIASLGIQATLAFPQLISNQRNRSVEGLSIVMIIMWFFGDFGKTIYFILQNQPFQFILSGAVQLTVDTLILVQIMAFKEGLKNYQNVKQEYEIEVGDKGEAQGI